MANVFLCRVDYENETFATVKKLQKLNLDENERSLLKLVGLFEYGKLYLILLEREKETKIVFVK